MISLETAFKYAMKGRANGPSIKTSVEPAWDLQKFEWPTIIKSGNTYDSATDSIEFTQTIDSSILKVLPTGTDTHPELGDSAVKNLMAFSIAENVTKGFFFRIHHSNYPTYTGEMYIMPVEEDLFVETSAISLQVRYSGFIEGTTNKVSFSTDDVIRVYPYKLVKSERVSTINYESYLFGHPNDWPDFIKQNGAIATRPIFGRVGINGNKNYVSQIPSDIEVASTGYRYLSLPNSLPAVYSVIVNGSYRYGGNIYRTGDHNVLDGYGNSNNGTVHRINNLPDNSWALITGTRTADIFKTADTNESNTGALEKGQSYEESGFIIGENDKYSGKYLSESILKMPRNTEGQYNPENTKMAVLEKTYNNSWIENPENSPIDINSVIMQKSIIGNPGINIQDSKLRLYAYLTKHSYNYALNLEYEEMVPFLNNDTNNILKMVVGETYTVKQGQSFMLPVGLNNKQMAGMVVYVNTDATFELITADWLAGYYIVNETIYSSSNSVSGIQLYNNSENSWGIDENKFTLNNSKRTNYFVNKNGVKAKKGLVTIKLPHAVIN